MEVSARVDPQNVEIRAVAGGVVGLKIRGSTGEASREAVRKDTGQKQ